MGVSVLRLPLVLSPRQIFALDIFIWRCPANFPPSKILQTPNKDPSPFLSPPACAPNLSLGPPLAPRNQRSTAKGNTFSEDPSPIFIYRTIYFIYAISNDIFVPNNSPLALGKIIPSHLAHRNTIGPPGETVTMASPMEVKQGHLDTQSRSRKRASSPPLFLWESD